MAIGLDRHATLLVEFGGQERAVRRQVREAKKIGEERGARKATLFRGDPARDLWRGAADLPGDAWDTVFKTTLPPASVGAFLDALPEAFAVADLQGSLLAHLGRGIIYSGTETSLIPEQLVSVLAKLVGVADSMGGHTIVEKTRPELKEGFDVWGPRPDAFAVMERLKNEFDSRGVLNPGRYLGGL